MSASILSYQATVSLIIVFKLMGN